MKKRASTFIFEQSLPDSTDEFKFKDDDTLGIVVLMQYNQNEEITY